MSGRGWTRWTTVLLAAALPAAGGPRGGHEHHMHPPQAVEDEAVHGLTIPDVELVDQDGRPVRFYSDLIEGRVVAVNFVFTTCTTVCPPMGANFAKLRKLLDESPATAGAGLISVSVDPVVDTPSRLDAWGDKFGRGDGWTLVTGSKHEIDQLLKALKVFTPDKDDHSPIVLVGDDATGEWTRAYGLAPPARLAEIVGGLVESRAR